MISATEARIEFEKWLAQTCTVKAPLELAWEAWQGALNPKFNKHLHPPKTFCEQLYNYHAGKACRDVFFPDEDPRLSCALREALKIYRPLYEGKGWRFIKTVAEEAGKSVREARAAAMILKDHGYLVNKPCSPGNTKLWSWKNAD